MPDSANVLMVDDELVVLEAFVDILEDEGYTMFTADSGERAVEILRANPIDIVVTDIHMPGMDGLELLGVIQEIDADIPVIMATAYSSIENTVECMRRGASNYLIKPIKVELLRSVLKEARTKRSTLREKHELARKLKKGNEELRRLNDERERVVEVMAQGLRQPLVDQTNWCELLMSDTEHTLHRGHLERVAKINSAASDMLAHVQELLDAERIRERSRATEGELENEEPGETPGRGSPLSTASGSSPEETGAVNEAASVTELETAACPDAFARDRSRLDFKILLVEDSAVLRDLLVSVLQRRFQVLSAADGWDALQLMVERPDLIVTELNLPSVGATEMLRHARHILGDVAVLAMYDVKDKKLLASTRSLGVQETISKPFGMADLVERVEALAGGGGRGMNESILVVCADAHERYALSHLLGTRYRTQAASSAKAAMEAAEDHHDLLLIDTAAAEYSWEDVVTFCRGRNRYIRVLALTDGKDQAVAQALKDAGVDSAMLMPHAVDELLFRVRQLLGIREIDGRVFRSVYRRVAI